MKIALLSFEYPLETGFGGIGTYTWYQARALVKLGHEVHVLAGAKDPTPLRMQEHDGVKVYRFRTNGRVMGGFQQLNKLRLWWTKNRLENAVSMYRGLAILRRVHNYNVVEMPECGAEGLLINNLMQTPTFVRFHSPAQLIMSYYDVRRADIAFCSLLERIAFRGAGAFSSCSQFLAKEVHQKLGLRRPIRVIPNGIDLELFDRAAQVNIRRKLGIPRDRLMIFFSGRMEARKGIHLCKEIAASILERYELAFVFAGQDVFNYMSDTLLPYLNTRKLRGSVHYMGRLNLTEVRSCLKQADIFLLPSLWENCPYSCLEAMAAGRPIVASDQGGMPELIRNAENGLLARSEDPASYISSLEKLIENKGLRERLGTAARETIEKSFTDVHIARISAEHYRERLNQSKRRWVSYEAKPAAKTEPTKRPFFL
jgi:glycosyltransferase involved in cell wall biosynthesis